MLINLPRQCSGQEIVDAFKAASSFQESPEKKWCASEVIDEFQYEPGSVLQTIRSIGVKAVPHFFKKRWVFFGEKVWKEDYNPSFTLQSVVLKGNYEKVDIKVAYIYDVNQAGNSFVATNPHHPEFEHVRPQFEKILARFFTQLQSVHV